MKYCERPLFGGRKYNALSTECLFHEINYSAIQISLSIIIQHDIIHIQGIMAIMLANDLFNWLTNSIAMFKTSYLRNCN